MQQTGYSRRGSRCSFFDAGQVDIDEIHDKQKAAYVKALKFSVFKTSNRTGYKILGNLF